VGLVDLQLSDRMAFGIDECAKLPLFTPQLIELMRRVIPPQRQSCVATSVIVRARKP
jgi:arsenite methyltransferase